MPGPGSVLVLDGNENQAVACVRSLARTGRAIWVGSDCAWSKAGWSRYCSGTFRYPAAQRDAAGFVRTIVAELGRRPGALVLPMTEGTTLLLSAERQRIAAAGGRLVLPPHATVLRTFDKQQTVTLAGQLGIAVPKSVLVAEVARGLAVAQDVGYPVVLKPRSSEELDEAGNPVPTGRPRYARSPEEFGAAFNELRRRCSSVLVQEYIEGAGLGYFALMNCGRQRAEFAHRRLRDVRPTGSGSCLRESIEPPPAVRAAGRSMLEALPWHGVAMVEFRVRADGTPVFMEVNGRFWNSLPLAVCAGADFPALLARMAEEGDIPVSPGYRAGVRCRWLLGDVRHLVEVWRGAPAGYPGKYPRRARALQEFLFHSSAACYDNFALNDPLPELGDWLNFVTRRLPSARKAT